MNELSLFTGAGGGLLGTHLLGWNPIGYVEFNDYCQRVIRARIDDGILPNAPIFGDVRAFIDHGYAASYQGLVDCVTGGFPCQPFSVAGKRAGADDERNMWPATRDCVRIIRPRYCLFENVPGVLNSGYFGTIVNDLAESGYCVRWRILSAAEMGAPHKRDRLWIVADSQSLQPQRGGKPTRTNSTRHSGEGNVSGQPAVLANANSGRRDERSGSQWQAGRIKSENSSEPVSHSHDTRLAQRQGSAEAGRPRSTIDGRDWWSTEP